MFAKGVADLFEVAEGRDGRFSSVAATTVLRSEMEIAGALCWLLDRGIEPAERCRRFLTWRFEGQAQQRSFQERFATDPDDDADVEFREAIGGEEAKLLDLVHRTGWVARPWGPNHEGDMVDAALMKPLKKPNAKARAESVPKIEEHIELLVGDARLYFLASAVAHGHRWARRMGVVAPADGGDQVRITGYAFSPGQVVAATCLALSRPVTLFGQWTGDETRARKLAEYGAVIVGQTRELADDWIELPDVEAELGD
jgi:hypothetical protein